MNEHTTGHANGVSPNGNGNGNGHAPASPTLVALPLTRSELPSEVVAKLGQPLDPKLVSWRQGRGGRSMVYLEGHRVIDQANRIFGYGGWGYSVIGDVAFRELSSVDAKTGEVRKSGMYCATLRVDAPGVPSRTDVGCQPITDDTPDGHETAYKGAVTDALKRALRSFGPQFGNQLYGDGALAAAHASGRGGRESSTQSGSSRPSAAGSANKSAPRRIPSASSRAREVRPRQVEIDRRQGPTKEVRP